MIKHRFSIVIPTRERADTLFHTLKTCIAQDYDDCEIIVSDNHSADHTRDVVTGFNDARVKYTNPGRRLGMGDNFEHAFEQISRNTVAICIGDDDGLMPGALQEANEIMTSERVEALAGTRVHYDWPGLLAGRSNQLVLPIAGARITTRRTADFVKDVLSHRCSYGTGPILYQGFVASRVLETIKARTGRLFRTVSPDLYAVFAISAVLREYTVTQRCLVIDGASPRSTGAALFGLSPDATEANNFGKENNWPMYPGLLPARSVLIGEADSYLHARDVLSELSFEIPWHVILPGAYGEVLAQDHSESIRAVELMAERFGVRLPSRGIAAIKYRSRRFSEGLRRWRNNLYIDCSPFGVGDVHGAAQLAHFARQWVETGCDSKMLQARQIVRRLRALGAQDKK